MALPFIDQEKEKQQKARKKRRNAVIVLFLLAASIFGFIYFKLKQESVSVFQTHKTNTDSEPLPMVAAPCGESYPSVKYEPWFPYFFKNKLIYCDSNFRVHVKTGIDADKVISADQFSDGLARLQLKDEESESAFVYVGTDGSVEIPKNNDQEYSGPFSEGLACFVDKTTGRLGFMDKNGKTSIKPQFYLTLFDTGNTVHRQDQLENSIFSNGLAPVYTASVNAPDLKPSCGFINHKGKFVIPVSYLEGCPFVHERARVCVKDQSKWRRRWGYIDPHGKILLKPIYMKLKDFSEGLAAVLDYKGQWGYVDKDGNYKIPARFADAESFSGGFAACSVAGAKAKPIWGYVRKDGSWLVEPRFEKAEAFKDGIAHAFIGCDSKSASKKEEYTIHSTGKVEKEIRNPAIPIDSLNLPVAGSK